MVFGKARRLLADLVRLTDHANWGHVLNNCADAVRKNLKVVITIVTMRNLAEFDMRFIRRLERNPLKLLLFAMVPPNQCCERRKQLSQE